MSFVWTAWLFAVAASFTILEGLAYFQSTQMLTGWVRVATERWPFVPYVFVMFAIAIAVHFWLERYAK